MKKTEANGSVGGGEPQTEEVIFCAAAISTSLSIFDGPIFNPFLTGAYFGLTHFDGPIFNPFLTGPYFGLDWPLFCVALQPSSFLPGPLKRVAGL